MFCGIVYLIFDRGFVEGLSWRNLGVSILRLLDKENNSQNKLTLDASTSGMELMLSGLAETSFLVVLTSFLPFLGWFLPFYLRGRSNTWTRFNLFGASPNNLWFLLPYMSFRGGVFDEVAWGSQSSWISIRSLHEEKSSKGYVSKK